MSNETKVVKIKASDAKVVQLKPTDTVPDDESGFPEQLKIGHFFYSVRAMDGMESAVSGNLGYCDDNALEIAVADNIPDQMKVEVLLHEVLHACFETSSLRHDDALTEERVVTSLAKSLVALLIDNPDLIPWMAENHPGIKLP